MRPEEIPDDVRRFIDRHIDSVPHLEALLLLREHAADAWTPDAVAERIYVPKDHALAILADLARAALIADIRQSSAYRYDPECDHASMIARVADTYRRHLVSVATLIHSRGSAAVRDFARAFEIKKRD